MGVNIIIVTVNPFAPTQTFVRRQIEHLGCDPAHVVHENPRSPYSFENEININKSLFARVLRSLNSRLNASWLSSLIARYPDKSAIKKITELENPFIIFQFGTDLLRFQHLIKCTNAMFCVYFRGVDASRKLQSKAYVTGLTELIPRASFICAVSKSLIKNLDHHGICHPSTLIIPSGTDVPGMQPRKVNLRTIEIASIGRLVEKKGFIFTIQAIDILRREFPGVKLKIIGSGPLERPLRDLVKSMGLDSHIDFLGTLEHKKVVLQLTQCTVYTQHSITTAQGDEEGLPSSIQEAMAMGLPVVSSIHAGTPYVLNHDVNALLFPEKDFARQARYISEVLNDKYLADRLSKEAHKTAKRKFDFEKNYTILRKAIYALF